MYHSLNDKKYKDGEHIHVCQRLEKSRELEGCGKLEEGSGGGPRRTMVMNVQHPDCDRVNFLVVTLCYSSGRGYHLGEVGERYTGFLCLISCSCMWSYNVLKIKSLIKSKYGCHIDNNRQDTCNYGESG